MPFAKNIAQCRRVRILHQNKNGTRPGAIFVLVRVRGLELSRTHARRAPRMFSCGFKSRILLRKTEKFGVGSRNQLPSRQKENPHPNGRGFPFCGAGKRTLEPLTAATPQTLEPCLDGHAIILLRKTDKLPPPHLLLQAFKQLPAAGSSPRSPAPQTKGSPFGLP
ncbi:MAG: hypothetical protein IKM08_07265, partial [Clostridia bacterium]|nr:hypothetical protein [Clostridia bacterium]